MLGLGVSAKAQTTLVSNLGEATAGTATILSLNHRLAQSFTMGGTSQALQSILLPLRGVGGEVFVDLYDDALGRPTNLLASLGSSGGLGAAVSNYTFAPAGNFTLLSNAKYWVVARTNPIGGQWAYTNSTNYLSNFGASLSPTANWAFSSNSGATWTLRPLSAGPHQLEVRVNPVSSAAPEPSTLALLSLAGGVALATRRRRAGGSSGPS